MGVTLKEGLNRLDISLTPSVLPSYLCGIVYDATSGDDVKDVLVTADGYSDYTDISGYFSIPLPVGSYGVSFSKAGYEPYSTTRVVKAGENHMGSIPLTPIVVPTTATLFGLITDSKTGTGLPNADVVLNGISDYADYYGKYHIFNIPFGSYTVTFSKLGYTPITKSVNLPTGVPFELNIALVPTEEIIRLTSLEIVPTEPGEGGVVRISCLATNHSPVGATLSRTIDLWIDGSHITSQTVTLVWAESRLITFEITAMELGSHIVELDGLTGSYEVHPVAVNYLTRTPLKLAYSWDSAVAFWTDIISIQAKCIFCGRTVTLHCGADGLWDCHMDYRAHLLTHKNEPYYKPGDADKYMRAWQDNLLPGEIAFCPSPERYTIFYIKPENFDLNILEVLDAGFDGNEGWYSVDTRHHGRGSFLIHIDAVPEGQVEHFLHDVNNPSRICIEESCSGIRVETGFEPQYLDWDAWHAAGSYYLNKVNRHALVEPSDIVTHKDIFHKYFEKGSFIGMGSATWKLPLPPGNYRVFIRATYTEEEGIGVFWFKGWEIGRISF